MNCRDAENLLFAERDGALDETQRADLARHLEGCAGCRQLRTNLADAAASWRARTADVAVPDAEHEWQKLRAQLTGAQVRTAPKRRLAPVIWLAAPLAAAAAIALTFFLRSTPATPPDASARAEFVEAGAADATTMVYTDKESGWLVVWAAGSGNSG